MYWAVPEAWKRIQVSKWARQDIGLRAWWAWQGRITNNKMRTVQKWQENKWGWWEVFGGARAWSRAPEIIPRHQSACPEDRPPSGRRYEDPHFGKNVTTTVTTTSYKNTTATTTTMSEHHWRGQRLDVEAANDRHSLSGTSNYAYQQCGRSGQGGPPPYTTVKKTLPRQMEVRSYDSPQWRMVSCSKQ